MTAALTIPRMTTHPARSRKRSRPTATAKAWQRSWQKQVLCWQTTTPHWHPLRFCWKRHSHPAPAHTRRAIIKRMKTTMKMSRRAVTATSTMTATMFATIGGRVFRSVICPSKYDSSACSRVWRSLKPQPSTNPGLSIGTLIKWARTDTADDAAARERLERLVRTPASVSVSVSASASASTTPPPPPNHHHHHHHHHHRDPLRLFVEATAPAPSDPTALASQLASACAAFLACHCSLDTALAPGPNCVAACGSATGAVPGARAAVVFDLVVAGSHELQALTRELVNYVTYHHAAFPHLVVPDASREAAIVCTIRVPALTHRAPSGLDGMRLVDGQANAESAESAVAALASASALDTLQEVVRRTTSSSPVSVKCIDMRYKSRAPLPRGTALVSERVPPSMRAPPPGAELSNSLVPYRMDASETEIPPSGSDGPREPSTSLCGEFIARNLNLPRSGISRASWHQTFPWTSKRPDATASVFGPTVDGTPPTDASMLPACTRTRLSNCTDVGPAASSALDVVRVSASAPACVCNACA